MGCTNCSDNLISGTVPLTAALLKKVDQKMLDGLEPEYVEDYLRNYFTVKVSYMVSQ